MRTRPGVWIVSALLGLAASVVACEDHSIYLENEPEPHQWGTFGEEVYRLVHDSTTGAPGDGLLRAQALEDRREAVIEAVDATLPPRLYDPASLALAGTLERIDDGTMPRLTRSTSTLLDRLGDDRATLDAATALRDQPWAASRNEVYELIRHAALARTSAGEPILVPLAGDVLRLARDHDGRDDSGALTIEEPGEVRELARSLTRLLEELDIDELDEAHSFDSSLVERLVAAAGIPYDADPVWVVRVDGRGLPRVTIDPNTDQLYEPFVDVDGDGLADATAAGELITAGADPAELAIYGETRRHASDGRALAYDGRPIYEYVDATRSGAGVIAYGLLRMAQDDTHGELVHLVDDLLSPRTPAFDERDDSYYESFPAGRTESLEPLFDIAWALIEATREQPPERLLYGTENLIRTHRGDVRRLLEETLHAADLVAEVDHGELGEHNTLLDDLILEENPPGAVCYGPYDEDLELICEHPPGPLLPRMIETGILRDLVEVFDDPQIVNLAETTATLMTYRDEPIDIDASELNHRISSGPESADNRSVFQRLLHLVHDTNGASFSTVLGDVLIDWRVENMAVFYLDSYCATGEDLVPSLALLVLGDYFESERPRPEEIARFMAVDHSSEFPIYATPAGREGHDLFEYNADTLLALEFTGMNQAMRPIVQVFCDHDELLLLANLFSVLHEHYSTLPAYTTTMTTRYDFYTVERPAGVRTYEAAIAHALTGSDVLNAALAVGADLEDTTVYGDPILDDVEDFLSHLISQDTSVLLRVHDDDPTRDQIYRFDRQTPMAHPTHLNVITQRVAEAADAWDEEDEAVRDDLTAIFDLLSEYYLDWPGEDALRRDQAEYLVRVAERAVPVLADWSRENIDRGTWDTQIADARTMVDELEVSLTDLAQDPLLPATLDILILLLDDPEAGPLIREALLYFLTPAVEGDVAPGGLRDPFTTIARVAIALIQVLPDNVTLEQLARYLATILDPATSPIATLPGDLALLVGTDEDSVVLEAGANAMAGGVRADAAHAPALVVIAEALATLGRRDPQSERPLDPEDIIRISDETIELLDDSQHGLERIYDIVETRAPH